MKKYEDLFKSYNKAIMEECEKSMDTVSDRDGYLNMIKKARDAWEHTTIDGKTPVEIFQSLGDKELEEAFMTGAAQCDDFIPGSLAEAVIGRGVLENIWAKAFESGEINHITCAIRTAGMSKDTGYADRLIGLIYEDGEYGDLIKETARRALVDIGVPALLKMEDCLSGRDIFADNDFHLIIAMIEIDSGRKSENLYKLLKESFRKTSNKGLAARCIADYGDGRAVPLLRGYLERNMDNLDKHTVLDIKGAVLALGGSTEGIYIPY